MRKTKRTILIAMLICVITVPVCSAQTARSKPKPKHPTVSELLEMFAATQERTQSFIMKTDTTKKGKATLYNNVPMEMFSRSEVRFDGKRFNSRRRSWGDINPQMILTKEDANYKNILWDGKDYYQYGKAASDTSGRLIIRQYSGNYDDTAPRGIPPMAGSVAGTMRGYLSQDIENMEVILRNAESLSVRNTMQKIGDSNCYVIEAKTQSGRYKIWIDPRHSYQIAKAEIKRGPGDVVFVSKYTLPENNHIRSFINNVHFEKKGDLWIPVQWQSGLSRKYPSGSFSTHTCEVKITEFELNPDHESLKSFIPDIPNGTKVRIGEGGKKEFRPIKYIWQDGKVVDKDSWEQGCLRR